MGQYCSQCGTQVVQGSKFCHGCGAQTTNGHNISGVVAAQAAPESEKVFYDSNGVTVTNTRFIVPGQTYAMAGVTSVRFEKIPAKNGWGIFLLLFGLLLLLPEPSRGFGALLLVVGIIIVAVARATYAVALHSSSGESRAIMSRDSAYVGQVVSALNDAIVYRR